MMISCTTCYYRSQIQYIKSTTGLDSNERKKWAEFCHVCLGSETKYLYEKMYSDYGYGHWLPENYAKKFEFLEKELFEI